MFVRKSFHTDSESRRGSATLLAVMAAALLLFLCGAMLARSLQDRRQRDGTVEEHRALLAADAGVGHALVNVTAAAATNTVVAANLGDAANPLPFGGGSYWATVTDNLNGTFTVVSSGSGGTEDSAVQAVLGPVGGGVFDHAVFAGNSSADPSYELEFGGLALQADYVQGDVYSGNDVDVTGNAEIDGIIRAGGDVSGASGEEGVTLPIPDLASMNYAATADFMVADLFAGASFQWDDAGGTAWQVPESNPAHIFRKNPTNRSAQVNSTTKHDYFIEDPYESVTSGTSEENAYKITLSGISGEPGVSSNQKVFYIDGNLWLNNTKTFSFALDHNEPSGVQVTFVVSGNIYLSDNLYYENAEADGVAFIAMKDPNVPDSGNIYFGDPIFGTLKALNAYMYAENNFYDNNLDESGSTVVELYGVMSAGNQVLIERDFGEMHTKLAVDFDERLSAGIIEMPGIPANAGVGPDGFEVVHWRRVAQP